MAKGKKDFVGLLLPAFRILRAGFFICAVQHPFFFNIFSMGNRSSGTGYDSFPVKAVLTGTLDQRAIASQGCLPSSVSAYPARGGISGTASREMGPSP
jgi:hypothetical protein